MRCNRVNACESDAVRFWIGSWKSVHSGVIHEIPMGYCERHAGDPRLAVEMAAREVTKDEMLAWEVLNS
jgi:hypothetical protein